MAMTGSSAIAEGRETLHVIGNFAESLKVIRSCTAWRVPPQRDGIKNKAAATGLLSCILIVER